MDEHLYWHLEIASSFADTPFSDIAVNVFMRIVKGCVILKDHFREYDKNRDLYTKYRNSMSQGIYIYFF
jgi:hypothetical protein